MLREQGKAGARLAPRMTPIRGLTVVFVILGLAVCASCGSGGSASPQAEATRTPGTTSFESEATRVQAYLDARYKPSDVKHTFNTVFGETVDCIDFFAQPGVKELAARGTPLTTIPDPPRKDGAASRPGGRGPLSEYLLNGAPDENGSSRACPPGSVPFLRITAGDIEIAGGLDAYQRRAQSGSSPAHPPRPNPSTISGPLTRPISDFSPAAGSSSAPSQPSPALSASTPATSSAAPMPGWCSEFESSDLPGYAHVQQTLSAPTTTYLSGGSANLSIFTPTLSATNVQWSDHSVMEMWVYSGWGFQGFCSDPSDPNTCCTCTTTLSKQSLTNPPCSQTVEAGWDVDPGRFGDNSSHFFTFATNDGYNIGCYDGSQPSKGKCPVWVGYPDAPMFPGMILPGSTVGGTQYQLVLDVTWGSTAGSTFGGGSNWWVQSGVYEVVGSKLNSVDGDTFFYVGYYDGSSFSGPMASGEAQTIQIGGEVLQAEGGTWNVPMGSGKDPTTGWTNAAYAYGLTDPAVVGPVTVPANYTYSTVTPAPVGADTTNYFYLGKGADDYTWSQVTFDGTSPPAVAAFTLPGSLGRNVQTIAPVYVYDAKLQTAYPIIYALTTIGTGPIQGNNFLVQKYSWLTNAWSTVDDRSGNPVYLWGLTTDNSADSGTVVDQPFWGWTHWEGNETYGDVYTGDSGNIVNATTGSWGGFTATSVAVASKTNIVATSNQENCTGLGGVGSLPCIMQFVPSTSGVFPAGSWIELLADQPGGSDGTAPPTGPNGAEQVVFDAVIPTLYALDSGGNVWYSASTTAPVGWQELATTRCGGATQTFVQIAAKNGVVYGLGAEGKVWFYRPTVLSAPCWTQVGSKAFAVSIATDNGDTTGVWATDTSGNIWTAE
jgi:hypothetical protein